MQVFFVLSRIGIDGDNWSKRKFHQHVTTYLEGLPGAQFACMLESGTGWDAYKCLAPVPDEPAALALRKHVNELCKRVSLPCRPFYFRFRKKDAPSVDGLSMMGLTPEESVEFQNKAPRGVRRHISV